MKINLYTNAGAEKGQVELPESVFALPWNADLVHGVVVAMQANARAGTAHTKDRSEVRGGGKKPWKQKGTGRARHGSRRSPIWVGGGVAHGPRNEKDYSVKINKKVRAKALGTVLSKKLSDTEVVALEAVGLDDIKAAAAKDIIKAIASGSGLKDLATKRKNAALVVLPERDEVVEKSFRNFGHIAVVQAKDVNPVDLLTYKYTVLVNPAETAKIFESRIVTNK